MTKKKKMLAVAGIVLVAAMLVGGTYASWNARGEAINVINTGALAAAIEEVYNPPKDLIPGVDVEKVVNVKNTGGVDIVVRVSVEKAWGESRDVNGNLIVNRNLLPENIEIAYNTRYWEDGGDGYFYYRGILKPGESTREPLFSTFKVKDDVGNEYKNVEADIVVKMQALQAGGNAIEAEWKKSFDYLGVSAPVTPVGDTTSVTLYTTSNSGNFVFNPTTTDLFDNFKDLVPGETRQQVIEITNGSEAPATIYFWAEYVDQTLATAENRALVNQMLQEYAQIKITDINGAVVYEGPVWGNYPVPPIAGQNNSMRDAISLGLFTQNQMKRLTVTLTLDPKLDNTYQNLWGLIKWVFYVEGNDPDTPPTTNPNDDPTFVPDDEPSTGIPGLVDIENDGIPLGNVPQSGDDSSKTMILAAILILSALAIVLVLRMKNEEDAA